MNSKTHKHDKADEEEKPVTIGDLLALTAAGWNQIVLDAIARSDDADNYLTETEEGEENADSRK